MKLLFICRYNEVRSRTAGKIYGGDVHSAKSAGTSETAVVRISDRLIKWADLIFVMEDEQGDFIRRNFAGSIGHREIIVLEISDSYSFMEPELVRILRERIDPHLEE